MKPTDIRNPDYFHKVVDCQWACPAHTNVPEYIRLIAQGRYTDAYMVNRKSNIFPGVPAAPATGLVSPPAAADARRKTCRHLPSQARRGRSARRHFEFAPAHPRAKERQARGLHRRRTVLARRRQRSDASRLSGHHLRKIRQARRSDAQQHPVVPPACAAFSTTRSA